MTDPKEDLATALGHALLEAIEVAVERGVEKALSNGHRTEDKLLTAEQASELLSVSVPWLYANAKRLPFTKKLGRKMLRFSYLGLQKWLTTRKVS